MKRTEFIKFYFDDEDTDLRITVEATVTMDESNDFPFLDEVDDAISALEDKYGTFDAGGYEEGKTVVHDWTNYEYLPELDSDNYEDSVRNIFDEFIGSLPSDIQVSNIKVSSEVLEDEE